MSSDPREAIALLRYRIVAAATDPRLTPAERGQLVRAFMRRRPPRLAIGIETSEIVC
jgi:hypothetical protein